MKFDLIGFAREILADFPESGGLDEFDLQELAIKHGLLIPRTEEQIRVCWEKDNGDGCCCSASDDTFPTTCYERAPELVDAEDRHIGRDYA